MATKTVRIRNFDVQVVCVDEFDDSGVVFGRPDQVELDLIIKNGLLIICELKSSIDKAGMYIFERKVRFYEDRHARKSDRMIVISPMIEPRARQVGAPRHRDVQRLRGCGESVALPVATA